jgi:hypothetical protein
LLTVPPADAPEVVWMARVPGDPLSAGLVRVVTRIGEAPTQLLLERTMRMRWREPSHRWVLVSPSGRTWFPSGFAQSDDRRGRWLDVSLQSVDVPTSAVTPAPAGWFLVTADATPQPVVRLGIGARFPLDTVSPSSGALAGRDVLLFRSIVTAPGWSVSPAGVAAAQWIRPGVRTIHARRRDVSGPIFTGTDVSSDSTVTGEAAAAALAGHDFAIGAQWPNAAPGGREAVLFWSAPSGTVLADGDVLEVVSGS